MPEDIFGYEHLMALRDAALEREATERRHLMSQVTIQYDAVNHRYIAQLHGLEYQFLPSIESNDVEIRHRVKEHLVLMYQRMERPHMPTTTTTTYDHFEYDTGTTSSTAEWPAFTIESAPPVVEAEDLQAPVFHMQQNMQEIEIRALRQLYPPDIFRQDFSIPPHLATRDYRMQVRDAISRVRRVEAACIAVDHMPTRLHVEMEAMLRPHLQQHEIRYIFRTDPDMPRGDISTVRTYLNALETIHDYRHERNQYALRREMFAGQQADYQQRVAMIRQRPVVPVDIDTQEILEVVSQWENVWGISVKTSDLNGELSEEHLFIRIGLCDIVMSESAQTTRYDYPADIRLAPFFFTIRLAPNGQFLCRSGGGNVRGLSRYEPGELAHDIHPHQLSDSPCFGSFGQTFVDMAVQGGMIALISGLIAFYSQYNSQDSAGVEATAWHPGNLRGIANTETYFDLLHSNLLNFAPYYVVDESKLEDAILRYDRYHLETRNNEAAPYRDDRYYCASCGEEDVSDDTEYYVAHDERICPGCWADHYCGDCERHQDDCICSHDDDRY